MSFLGLSHPPIIPSYKKENLRAIGGTLAGVVTVVFLCATAMKAYDDWHNNSDACTNFRNSTVGQTRTESFDRAETIHGAEAAERPVFNIQGWNCRL